MISSCRALRSQINAFESHYNKAHGRAPKTAQDRAPIRNTYEAYRLLKRDVRNDASRLLQRSYRSWARCGKKKVNLVVPEEGVQQGSHDCRGLSDFGNKVEVDNAKSPSATSRFQPSSWRKATSSSAKGIGIGIGIGSEEKENSDTAKNAANGGKANDKSGYAKREEPKLPNDSEGAASGDVATVETRDDDVDCALSLRELSEKKRSLKSQLKEYDMNFVREKGRMPVKAEKEPIRHLYEEYNRVKDLIVKGKEGREQFPETTTNEDGAAEGDATGPSSSSSSRKQLGSSTVHSLRVEKATLHQKLRSYEKEFVKREGRQVSSFGDIKPVAALYRRYKEIKKIIAITKG